MLFKDIKDTWKFHHSGLLTLQMEDKANKNQLNSCYQKIFEQWGKKWESSRTSDPSPGDNTGKQGVQVDQESSATQPNTQRGKVNVKQIIIGIVLGIIGASMIGKTQIIAAILAVVTFIQQNLGCIGIIVLLAGLVFIIVGILPKFMKQNSEAEINCTHMTGNDSDLFYTIFCASYIFAVKKAEKNEKLNFDRKRLFRLVLILYAVIQVIILVCACMAQLNEEFFFTVEQFSIKNILSIELVLLVLFLSFLLAIVKELDVYKYQETWARHQYTLYRYRQAMMEYMDEYKDGGNNEVLKKRFKEKIYNIMLKNEEKFASNMEEKEKGMMEQIESLIESLKR